MLESKIEKAKELIRKNWKPFTIGVAFTGVTLIVTKRFYWPNMMLARSIVIKDNVFLIHTQARLQGSPSWIVECLETRTKFTSQAEAAKQMGISTAKLSRHLNGTKPDVNGYHFKRLAIAVPSGKYPIPD